MKIDVEGYELEVLPGAATVLADRDARPRAVFLELRRGCSSTAGTDPNAFAALLPGYELERVGTRGLTEHWVGRSVVRIEQSAQVVLAVWREVPKGGVDHRLVSGRRRVIALTSAGARRLQRRA